MRVTCISLPAWLGRWLLKGKTARYLGCGWFVREYDDGH